MKVARFEDFSPEGVEAVRVPRTKTEERDRRGQAFLDGPEGLSLTGCGWTSRSYDEVVLITKAV